jgi:hypothetical protein
MRRFGEEREAFVARLVDEGRILATERELAIALLRYLDLHDGEILARDGRRFRPVAALESLLESKARWGPQERLTALAEEKSRKEGKSFAEAFRTVQFECPQLARDYYSISRQASRTSVHGDPIERLTRIAEEKARSEGISFSEAFREAQAEHPSIAREWMDSFSLST